MDPFSPILMAGVLLASIIPQTPARGVVVAGASNDYLTNLKADWTLDESGTLVDVQNGYNMARSGTTTTTSGALGNAFSVSGAGYASVADNADLSVGDVDWSIEFTMRPSSIGGLDAVVGKGTDWLFYLTTGASGSLMWQQSGSDTLQTTSASMAINTTYHIVAVFRASDNNGKVYINGTQNKSQTVGVATDGSGAFIIGAYNTSTAFPYSGWIDNIRFWKRELDSTAVTFLYNGGALRAHSELH